MSRPSGTTVSVAQFCTVSTSTKVDPGSTKRKAICPPLYMDDQSFDVLFSFLEALCYVRLRLNPAQILYSVVYDTLLSIYSTRLSNYSSITTG